MINQELIPVFLIAAGFLFYTTWLHAKIDSLASEVRFLSRYIVTPEE